MSTSASPSNSPRIPSAHTQSNRWGISVESLNPHVAYILRLPNEILSLIFDAAESQLTYRTERDVHRLAVVCRRFREMLVHDLYRFVALPKYSFQARARSALISLLPSHGHHVHHLEASAPAESRPYEPDDAQVSNLLVSLSRCASQFTQLRSLQLHLYTVDRTLSTEQQADLVDMFKVLPPQMQELDLAGFLWTGAAKALAAAQQPILQRLSLNLESIPGAWMAPVKLPANFPALLHIHIPARFGAMVRIYGTVSSGLSCIEGTRGWSAVYPGGRRRLRRMGPRRRHHIRGRRRLAARGTAKVGTGL